MARAKKQAEQIDVVDAGALFSTDQAEAALAQAMTQANAAAASAAAANALATAAMPSATLASTSNGQGASLVGINDPGSLYTASQVEAALQEVMTRAQASPLTSNLASTSPGQGASLIGINDAGGLFTAAQVEAALQEVMTRAQASPLTSTLASTSLGQGASLIGINDAGALFTASQVEAALQEVMTRAQASPLSSTLASTSNGQGASLIGIQDAGGIYVATQAEAAFQEVMTRALASPLTTDLASTLISKGASTIGVHDAAGNFTGTDVEAALAELALRASPTLSPGELARRECIQLLNTMGVTSTNEFFDDMQVNPNYWFTESTGAGAFAESSPNEDSSYILYSGGDATGYRALCTGRLVTNQSTKRWAFKARLRYSYATTPSGLHMGLGFYDLAAFPRLNQSFTIGIRAATSTTDFVATKILNGTPTAVTLATIISGFHTVRARYDGTNVYVSFNGGAEIVVSNTGMSTQPGYFTFFVNNGGNAGESRQTILDWAAVVTER